MLSPRLTNCPECASIPNLLKEIDCKLAQYAHNLYNNITFMLNQTVPADKMIQLIAYKRILTYKDCNPDYVSCVPICKIASKVIILTDGYTSPPAQPYLTTTSTSIQFVLPNENITVATNLGIILY